MHPDAVLHNWTELNKQLKTIDEKKCLILLEHEKLNKKRLTFLLRIYGKFNELRAERERRELVAATATK